MGKFSAFMQPLKSLPVGTHTFRYKLGRQFFVDMESSDVRDADLDVILTVKYDGDVYALDFANYRLTVKYGDDYNDDSDEVLEIPSGDAGINVAYMLYDTVTLAIPIKHVHPMGKCNRAMSAILKKHRARPTGDDADLEEELMEGIDDEESESTATDPRWDALRKLSTEENSNNE